MTFDCPWEGITTSEITIFKDGDRYRMYYGGDNASKSRKVKIFGRATDP